MDLARILIGAADLLSEPEDGAEGSVYDRAVSETVCVVLGAFDGIAPEVLLVLRAIKAASR